MLRYNSAQVSLRHIWAVTRKEFNHIVRDRSTLILVLFTPTLMLLLMAYALTVDISHVPVAVLDYDQSKTSRAFIQQITAGEDLDIYAYVSNMDEIEAMLMRGEIKAAVVISKNVIGSPPFARSHSSSTASSASSSISSPASRMRS